MKEIVTSTDELVQASNTIGENFYRFAQNEIFNFVLPSKIISSFKNHSFSFHERCPGDIEPQLASSSIDFGVTTHPISQAGVRHTFIGNIELSLFISINVEFNNDFPFIIPNSLFNSTQRDHWKGSNIKRKNVIRANMLSIALELTKEGHGSVYAPKFVIENSNAQSIEEKQLIAIDNTSTLVPIYLATKVGNLHEKELISDLINVIKNSCCEFN